MNDPLNDKIIGTDMAQGVLAGVIVMIILQAVNFTKFYQGKSRLPFDIPAAFIKLLCKPLGLHEKADALFERLPKGFGYMLVALVLTVLLFTPLGVAVGGMKVNLNIGILFQPSEIAKYLIIIFMAAFFCANADKIVKFSNKGNVDLFGSKMKMLGGIISGLIFLMGLYLLLGDMGPAMVLSFTFIIMYSIIKSKVDLEGLSEKDELKRILSCDLAMLMYGVLSFVAMLYIGNRVGYMWIFCLAWFALWIIFGLLKKRVFESAIVFNLIIAAFVFGASIMRVLPGLESVAERLESRNEMCTNTWGTLPVDGEIADPGENTQVAEGLWGLSSGGFLGQGVGEGSPSFIPAFHTDMILSSIGEQIGFVGILTVIILLILLLRKTVLHGYGTAHPFTFYLCLGIAVVTGVQFMIIALGSTGIIPLTSVTVPFLSFGKVSMILNLAAFGIVISIAGRNSHPSDVSSEVLEMRRTQMQKYDYSIALTSLAFTVACLFILGVYLNYQVLQRDEILIRPVYVNDTEGYPVVNYNPRIAQIADDMPIGNIYDRNGILLATSNVENIISKRGEYMSYGVDSTFFDNHIKQRLRRYYPFGEHLFYMLGDYNTRLFFTSGDMRGYLAEARHLSDLRGYDDRMSRNGEYVKVDLQSDHFKPGRYFDNDSTLVVDGLQLRDYKALLPSLKSGKPEGTHPKDVKLTLDAKLQTMLQNDLRKYVSTQRLLKRYPALRISVVVLDANKGDMLASAVYPLPDQDYLMSLKEEDLAIYRDSHRPESWTAYSDMDLGVNYATPPGSSAKILTAIAALKENGKHVSEMKIRMFPEEVIRNGEPGTHMEEDIMMHDALKSSSNLYFIHLLNRLDLYSSLQELYSDIDCRIDNYDEAGTNRAIRKYKAYLSENVKKKLNDGEFPRCWAWAWGQGGLNATPLAMARANSISANGGNLPKVRYTVNEKPESKPILDWEESEVLGEMLKYAGDISGGNITGGKTGTAERSWIDSHGVKNKHFNDGWFVFFMENADIDGHSDEKTTLSIAVRLERGPGSGSAKGLARNVVLPLLKLHYNN
jgi:cell division protein FtsW (lipid II flippase)/cell division protein FtsI/penicillin-binding protein 2